VDASLSGVMCDQNGACPPGGTILTEQEKDDMATFLATVAYPPARSRRVDDSVSQIGDGVEVTDVDGTDATEVGALEGFADFFFDQSGGGNPDTCADSDAGCHELPLGTASNSETLQAFDAPTMRGLTDRFLQFSIGPTNAEELLVLANAGIAFLGVDPLEAPIQWDPADGFREITTFGSAFAVFEPVYAVRPLDIFQMTEEASTGTSGATGRQVTLNTGTTVGCPACAAEDLLADLEAADARGVVNLRGNGLRNGNPVTISYRQATDDYQVGNIVRTRAQLILEAQLGSTLATLTAHLRSGVNPLFAQPLIAPVDATCGTGNGSTGDPALPDTSSFQLESKYVAASDVVFLDGQPAAGASITVNGTGDTPACAGDMLPDLITVSLGSTPSSGTHLLQIQRLSGLLSNEVPLPIP
jgi:hypothetical protein